jgi:hypothetical protein
MCKLVLILIEPGGGVRFGQEVPSVEGLTGQMKGMLPRRGRILQEGVRVLLQQSAMYAA